MKKLLVFLTIFAILFTSLNLTPNFKNNAEVVDTPTPNISQLDSVFGDIYYLYSSSATSVYYNDYISLGGSYLTRGDVSAFSSGVSYYGSDLNNFVSVTYSHTYDIELPPPPNVESLTTIDVTQSYSSSGQLLFVLRDFYFDPTLNKAYYGNLSLDNLGSIPYELTFTRIAENNKINTYTITGDLLDVQDGSISDILRPYSIGFSNPIIYIHSLSFASYVSDSFGELQFSFRTLLTYNGFSAINPLKGPLAEDYLLQMNVDTHSVSFDWLTNSVSSFLNFELFPNFSFASVIGVVFGLIFLIIILKVFFGG